MPPRFFVDLPLAGGAVFALPSGPARHVQVLRLQPGDALTLFDGRGGEWRAAVVSMGRREVEVRVDAAVDVDRELALDVTLAIGMPANERMDAVVEKATELGVACIQPLVCERSVLRLAGERAEKKAAHWRGVAIAAAEQSGRTGLPRIAPVATLGAWLAGLPGPQEGGDGVVGASGDRPGGSPAPVRWLLSPRASAALTMRSVEGVAGAPRPAVVCLSGPEGGMTDAEEAAARRHGFVAVSLGARILRADTAPLALLAHLALGAGTRQPG